MNQSFHQPLADLIGNRYSCRSYDGLGLQEEETAFLQGVLASLRPPFGSAVRFGLIDRERVKTENFFSTGTYGLIKGTRFFMAGIVTRGRERVWEDLGHCLETAVLHATDRGLETCWIGGVFDRRRFGGILEISEDELLPAVIAVGHAAGRRTLRDRLVRRSARGDSRRPLAEWAFAAPGRPYDFSAAPALAGIMELVRRAPSASNKQPWRFFLQDGAWHLFLDRDKLYSKMIPHVDLQRIDMGIALCHLELAAAQAGIPGELRVEPPAMEPLPENYEYIVSFFPAAN